MRYVNEKSLHSDQTDRLYLNGEPTLTGLVHYILQHPTTVLHSVVVFILIYAVIIALSLFFGA